MATLYAKSAGGNWTAAGTWSSVSSLGGDSSGPPTAADNTIFDANSGNVTIDSGAGQSLGKRSRTKNTGSLRRVVVPFVDPYADEHALVLRNLIGATDPEDFKERGSACLCQSVRAWVGKYSSLK